MVAAGCAVVIALAGCGGSSDDKTSTGPHLDQVRQHAIADARRFGMTDTAATQAGERRADLVAAMRAHDDAAERRATQDAAIGIAAGYEAGARHLLGDLVVREYRAMFAGAPAADRRDAGKVLVSWAARMVRQGRMGAVDLLAIDHAAR